MCGIVGQFFERIDSAACTSLQRGADSIRHRGPDGEGFALLSGAGGVHATGADSPAGAPGEMLGALSLSGGPGWIVGHRRLSIVALGLPGHQPMASPDLRQWLVYNGEVYNYRELRKELEGEWKFTSESDTEVVLAALSVWGSDAVRRFVGMFAFAWLDLRGRAPKCLLARDHFGIKPLYWTQHAGNGGFAFASEIKALLALGAQKEVDVPAAAEYLINGSSEHSENTFFSGIQQLLPGTSMLITQEGSQLHVETPDRFWQLQIDRTVSWSFDEAAERLRAEFLGSVRLHLRADVPVATALSGGIDSTAVTAAIRSLEPSVDLHSFSYTAPGHSCDEEKWIALAAAATGVTRHTTAPSEQELLSDLDELIRCQDEPFAGTSYYAEYAVYRLVREAGLKVLLNGQGSDEMFAGYPHYRTYRIASLLARFQLGEALRCGSQSRGGRGALREFPAAAMRVLPPSVLARFRGGVQNLEYLNLQEVVRRTPDLHPFRSRDRMRAELANTLTVSSIPPQLRCQDRSSMAFSIESRVPFLTPGLAEFAAALPEGFILSSDGGSKRILRAALRGLVPDEILDRKDKVGFATPEAAWLSGLRPFIRRQIESDACRAIPLLNHSRLRQLIDGLADGRSGISVSALWRVVNLIRWSECMGMNWKY